VNEINPLVINLPSPEFQKFQKYFEQLVIVEVGLPQEFFDPPDMMYFAA
jgi:hypothetical protein